MPIPIFRISMQNATVLSIAYLLVAMLIEASRRWFPFDWTEAAARNVAGIPQHTLHWVGLYSPIRSAVIEDRMSIFTARIIFGLTSVATIFFVALGVGAVMWVGRWLILRAEERRQRKA